MCSRFRSEVWPMQCICIHGCSMSWETVARSEGSFFRQQATKSHISALAPQPDGNVGGSSFTILFMMSQYLQEVRLKMNSSELGLSFACCVPILAADDGKGTQIALENYKAQAPDIRWKRKFVGLKALRRHVQVCTHEGSCTQIMRDELKM